MPLRRQKSFSRKFCDAAPLVLLLPLVLPLLVAAFVLHVLNKIVVYLLVWLCWLPKGRDVLFVSSDSPVWQEYMETHILPLVTDRAMVLNWSKRDQWSKLSLSVRVFRTFGGWRDFNPMIVLFRPFRRARVFRFWPAFKDWKHGHTERVEQLRRDMMVAL